MLHAMTSLYSLGSGNMLKMPHRDLHVAQVIRQPGMRDCFDSGTP